MKRLYTLALLIVTGLALAVAAGAAMAQVTPEAGATYGGHVYLDHVTAKARFAQAPMSAQVAGDVYDNTTSAAVFGFSSTDLAAVFGDRVYTTGAGVLDQNDFAVYNSGSSAGSLLTATYLISFYDGVTQAPLGSYTTGTVTFGTGLTPGYYSFVSLTGLAGLGIPIGTDVLVTQQVVSFTGTATRMGIVSLDPPTVGASGPEMFINAPAGGYPAGYYLIGVSNANPGYRINTISPTPTKPSTWGLLKSLYR